MFINLILNKEKSEIEVQDGTTIKELLAELDISSQTVVSKRNNDIVLEDEVLENEDILEIIQVIYGG